MDAVRRALPGLPAVASVDTAFHANLPAASATYALPREWRERDNLRRFGFHGLSHAYATRRAAEMLGRPPEMGFTPTEGLVMATRSGSGDPGLVLWLLDQGGRSVADVSDALEHSSGLLGLAGTSDMREVLARAGAGDSAAALARDVYVHRLRALTAAMAASLGGLDALVFTGGVGEHSSEIRRRAADGLGFLGVAVDADADAAAKPDADVTAHDAAVRTLVVRAREDLEMAREVRETLAAAGH